MVVISSAIPESNPEIVAARMAGIPVMKRAHILGEMMASQIGVAVAGTHGKTTITGMIAHMLIQTGQDPSLIMGGVLPSLGSNGHAGRGRAFVIEADEYDHMFLGLKPQMAVVANIEHDHPDMFQTEEVYLQAFRDFVNLLPSGGTLVAGIDDAGVKNLLATLGRDDLEVISYGLEDGKGEMQSLDIRPNQLGGADFLVQRGDKPLGIARLAVPGAHNVSNALAALTIVLELGVPFSEAVPSLAGFTGVGRRFELVGEAAGVTVIDDYAHHPTEIRVTLEAARQRFPNRRIWAVWQPHTFTRTRLLLREFASSFQQADRVIALDIYKSRETDSLGISTADVVQQMDHADVHYIPERSAAAALLLEQVTSGDVILTLGAGDGNRVGRWVLAGLADRAQAAANSGKRGRNGNGS